MTSPRRRFAIAATLASVAAFGIGGCASPGPPRSPSLQLPAPPRAVTALRRGNAVTVRFALPRNATDGVALRGAAITATLCRSFEHDPCRPTGVSRTFPIPPVGASAEAELTDTLPQQLTMGPAHLLAYRVQLANDRGRAAPFSDPGYTGSGEAPAPVSGFAAQGSRLGVVLTWLAAEDQGSRVILRREDLNSAAPPTHPARKQPAPSAARPPQKHRGAGVSKTPSAKAESTPEDNVALLSTGEEAGAPQGTATVDTTALTDEPYRYTAERRRTLELGGRSVELRSAASAPVTFTLHDVYPPPAPTDLTVAGFATVAAAGANAAYAVDLIWQPVDDPSLAGYNVYRETLDATAGGAGAKVKLNGSLVTLPAFHDTTAHSQNAYRYSVTSVDKKENESAPATATLSSQNP